MLGMSPGTRMLTKFRQRRSGTSSVAAPPAVASLSVTSNLLVFFDDFVRADSGTVGTPAVFGVGAGAWVEEADPEDQQILTNQFLMDGAGDGSIVFCHRPNAEAATGPVFAQASVEWSSTNVPAILNFFDTDAVATRSGYQIRANDASNVFLLDNLVNGSNTVGIRTTAFAGAINNQHIYEFFVDDGTQEEMVWLASTPATSASHSGTSTTHDGVPLRLSLQEGGSNAESVTWDYVWQALGKNIVVLGLNAGDGVWVRDESNTVISHATESGGDSAVTMSVSRFDGTLDVDDAWPTSGLSLLIVDSSGSEVTNFRGDDHPSSNIWPGIYTVSQ